jgi:hypothetical protein
MQPSTWNYCCFYFPSANSFAQNHPYIEVKSSSLKLPANEKGNKSMKEYSSS